VFLCQLEDAFHQNRSILGSPGVVEGNVQPVDTEGNQFLEMGDNLVVLFVFHAAADDAPDEHAAPVRLGEHGLFESAVDFAVHRVAELAVHVLLDAVTQFDAVEPGVGVGVERAGDQVLLVLIPGEGTPFDSGVVADGGFPERRLPVAVGDQPGQRLLPIDHAAGHSGGDADGPGVVLFVESDQEAVESPAFLRNVELLLVAEVGDAGIVLRFPEQEGQFRSGGNFGDDPVVAFGDAPEHDLKTFRRIPHRLVGVLIDDDEPAAVGGQRELLAGRQVSFRMRNDRAVFLLHRFRLQAEGKSA